jgi:tRNA pseudouridine55 synthase
MARRAEIPALHGWLIIDKPTGMTSARVVAAVKRATGAKVGHAGTLDPLATGVLPLALGEATKTAPLATAGRKRYRFRIRWGIATDTEDRDGQVIAESAARPDTAATVAALPRFPKRYLQRPPAYSAIKIAGRRAYVLARAGQAPELAARAVEVAELKLLGMPDPDHADFEASVSAGTYIRSLARDLAALLGTLGHIAELRRLQVGRFTETQAIPLEQAVELGHNLGASEHLLPIETALDDIPALALTAAEAARLRQGQRVPLHDLCAYPVADPIDRNPTVADRIAEGTLISARSGYRVVALARIENGVLRPVRIINY